MSKHSSLCEQDRHIDCINADKQCQCYCHLRQFEDPHPANEEQVLSALAKPGVELLYIDYEDRAFLVTVYTSGTVKYKQPVLADAYRRLKESCKLVEQWKDIEGSTYFALEQKKPELEGEPSEITTEPTSGGVLQILDSTNLAHRAATNNVCTVYYDFGGRFRFERNDAGGNRTLFGEDALIQFLRRAKQDVNQGWREVPWKIN